MLFKRRNKRNYFQLLVLFLTLFFCLVNSALVFSGEDDIRRRVAFKLFRATLAADTQIDQKTNNGILVIALVYSGNMSSDRLRAESFLQQFKTNNKISNIHNNPVQIRLFSEQEFINPYAPKELFSTMAGIYLLDELSEEIILTIINEAIRSQIITFSPFKGNVETGILGGLSVESKVRPYINMKTLEESQIQLKPFFLRVIKRYEPKK